MAGLAGAQPPGGGPINGGFHGGDHGRGPDGGVHSTGPVAGPQGGPVRSFDSVGPVYYNRGAGNVYGGVGNTSVTASGTATGYGGTASAYGGTLSGYGGTASGYYPYGAYGSTYASNAYPYDTSSYNASQYGTGGAYANYLSGPYGGDSSGSSTSSSYPYAGGSSESITYSSYYAPTAETAGPADTSAYLTVAVPADAQVWVDGQLTPQAGAVRQFYSPPLTPGQNYTYEVRARWMDGPRPVERVRQVPVRAGAQVTVDFRDRG